MFSDKEVIEFAIASARDAFAYKDSVNRDGSPTYADPIASFEENLVDTMNDSRVDGIAQSGARAAYRKEIRKLFGDASPFADDEISF
jgi:hypothetical protein